MFKKALENVKPKMEVKTKEINPDLLSEVTALLGDRLGQGFGTKDRAKREATIAEIKEEATTKWGNGHSSQDTRWTHWQTLG